MLTGRERRALQRIEQQILGDDPQFAASMKHPSNRSDRWGRRGYDAIIAVAALSAMLCLALSLVGAGVVAALLAAATFYRRPRHRPPRTDRWRSRRRRTKR
ncbi:MAG: hypothetical protein QOI36_1932 [Pseudonocardiales bacterium]|nr:hypothetical protein [Pseudonocardia sp.]MDT7650526.1 hypothetical protein [Pseudonocardiales bacterium]